MSITLVLVVLTCLVSIGGFSRPAIIEDLIFYPPAIKHRRQYYRFITHGFIHADPGHLIFNMIALYSFGTNLEDLFSFSCIFAGWGKLLYVLLYFSALVVASLPDYFKYRDSDHFRSLGASGAVSAIIFSTIIFLPQTHIGFIFLPVGIPGYVFGFLYLIISAYLSRRGGGRVNHGAHFWGAAYGILFTLLACQAMAIGFDVYENFMLQLHSSTDVTIIPCDLDR
jgi:membrane associated rhomboid family serine protease